MAELPQDFTSKHYWRKNNLFGRYFLSKMRDNQLLGSKYIFTNKQNYTKRLFRETGILQAVTWLQPFKMRNLSDNKDCT